MPKIETLILRTRYLEKQRQFYQDILGMRDLDNGRLGYRTEEANIHFLPAEHPYSPQSNDLYWKIALAVPNIELACKQLASKGISIRTPNQFRDIGYLTHFQDSEGFTVELIEHHFKGDRPNIRLDHSLLGGGAHLNLITLRTANIRSIEQQVLGWGMKPLSVQHVDNRGFTLYFYAFTSDTPPSAELHSIENRTWLYQRPYSVLEIQHVYALNETLLTAPITAGYEGVKISATSQRIESNQLNISSL